VEKGEAQSAADRPTHNANSQASKGAAYSRGLGIKKRRPQAPFLLDGSI
jgi:hypothetical protein